MSAKMIAAAWLPAEVRQQHLIGWQNRFLVVTYTAWVLVAAWQAHKRSR